MTDQLYSDLLAFRPTIKRMQELLAGRQAIEPPGHGLEKVTVYFGGMLYDSLKMTAEQRSEVMDAEIEWTTIRRRNPGLQRRINLFSDEPFTVFIPEQ